MNKIDGGITGDSNSSLTRESARGDDEEALLMMRSVVGAANDDAPSTTCTSARHAARTSNLVPNNELSNVSQIIENDIVSNNTDQSGSRALFDEIDAGINDIRNCSWTAKLRFPSYYCSPDEPLPYSSLYVASDLFELTQQVKGLAGMIARFDPSKYPVVAGGMKQNEQTWRKLSSDIMSESKNNGKLLLVSNGSWGSNEKKVLVCSRFRMYAEKARRPKAGGKLRARSINCDKRNARKGNGKSQKKRTSTSKALPGSDKPTCKAKLVIGIDSQSFFLVCGNGNDVHIGHSPLSSEEMPTRKCIVPEKAIAKAKQMAIRGAKPGLIAGILKHEFDVDLTRRQVAQTTDMAKLATTLISAEHLEKYKHCMSDTDRVLEYLESIDASYVALYHETGDCDPERPRQKKQKSNNDDASETSANSTTSTDKLIIETVSLSGNKEVTHVNETGENERNGDVMKYASDTRQVMGANDNQTVLVALVWTTPQGKRYFQAFPEQASVDGTHKTTKEEWELITLSIQDMNGGQETVIRCWAPNNHSWLYRWLFQAAIPTLVTKKSCSETQLIICDGDPQECSQLDSAIQSVFVNAKRRRCGWHIVEKGLTNHVGRCLGGKNHKNRKDIDNLIREIKKWLYSMMKEIENVEEYKVSKALLLSFLQSDKVSSILESFYINQILDFLRNHVFPHEELYARCYFLGVRAMDAYSNTPHEGTNNGAKYCENRVDPTMSQAESTKRLTEQDHDRAKTKRRQIADSFHKTQLHSSDMASQHIQKEADSHLKEENEASDIFISIRVNPKTWLLLCGTDRSVAVGNSVRPVFERVRIMRINDSGEMTCTCGYTDHFGVPDRHMAHVANEYRTMGETMPFSHHDVAIRHHNSYCMLVATKDPSELTEAELVVRSKLMEVREKELATPKLKSCLHFDECKKFAVGSRCDSTLYPNYESVLERINTVQGKRVSVLNYTESEVELALKRMEEGAGHAPGFSQSMHNCDDDNDGATITFNWDDSTKAAESAGGTAYAEGAPHAQDWLKAFEGICSPELRKEMRDELDALTNKMIKIRLNEQGTAAPSGSVVSAKIKSTMTRTMKQTSYGAGSWT